MKYYNKKKKSRINWTEVTTESFFPNGWQGAKIWCQQHSSPYRFYAGPYTHKWYFENSEDALVFKLKYLGK